MSVARRIRDTVLACALALGILADQLVRAPGRPGLNVTLWALAGVAVLVWLSRRTETRVSRQSRALVGTAVGFALLLMLRDAEALAVFCLFAAIVCIGLAAGRAASAWATRAHIIDIAAAAVRVAVLIALGPLGWSVGTAREPALASSGRVWPQRARMFVRGAIMAVPPLFVLTALLASGDPVFERLLFTGIEPLLEHLAFTALITWLTCGYLRAFFVRDDVVMERVRIPRPALPAAEITIALTLINALFLVFMIVQVRYLFGGSGLVEVTPGLSYAEYARRGFFELVAAAALVVPVLLIADWAAAEDSPRSRRALRAIALLLVLLLLGVLASAAYRMKLYQDAYGLTEDRLYGSVFMAWLTFVFVWLAATVLRGRRHSFAFGAIAGGLSCIVILNALNPHALIARVNLDRAAAGKKYDGRYLTTLSADAAPTLIERLPLLPVDERCRVATMLKKNWAGVRHGDWRTWNLSDARARRLVARLPTPAGCVRFATMETGGGMSLLH